MKFQNPMGKQLNFRSKVQKWIYLIYYGYVIVLLTIGLIIEFGPKELKSPIEEIHILSIYYLISLLILNVGGVLTAEFTDQKGNISRILSGSKKEG
jgi:hypothetical protein